ncbi:hypothetical protein AJ81_06665 [Pseudothermotoga hypogea DSM 11164 = NBRC 106472]|uniref:Glycosyl-hydrolase family 116 catalytic region domain-containing protein n=2 Tax=Pseudothermotoga TaxID=1643951 RepID=A0A0X1KTZ6_9THEM|nr:GH116 family glycosyl hydrolase [Pseudothermotoga hypogea]AJC74798.1 hypothetical protein AJ81_06665 [Pseudothermotoga hypogea DSM 11164 = NBRC 106472]
MRVLLVKNDFFDLSLENVEIVQNVDEADVVWFHGIFDPHIVQRVLGHRHAVFYGEAAAEVSKIIEQNDVVESFELVMSKDPWDKRGFQSYKYHPIFESLHGGFYTYLVLDKDTSEKVFCYRGKKARIVAVEKRYISVIRENALIWEYELDSKKILCIGGYLNFKSSHIQYNIHEAKQFVKNILEYMLSGSKKPALYWPSCSNETKLDRGLEFTKFRIKPLKDFETFELLVHEGFGEDYANLCGRRILANLKENGEFDEVWVHPFRIVKSISFKIDEKKISEQKIFHRIYPDRVIHETENFKLTSFVSLEKPIFMIQLDFKDGKTQELEVDFNIDSRIMWPFDEAFNCGKSFNICDETGEVVFQTSDGMLKAFIKMNVPTQTRWSNDENSLTFTMSTNVDDSVSICLGGFLEQEQVPYEVDFTAELIEYSSFLKNYLNTTLQLETNDELFDRMFQLAKIGTIKFLTSVPGIGEGLMAGYANSKPGWFSARPGYAWYFGRDSEWVSMALLDIGDWETVKKNLQLLMKYQRIDGKIFHELTSSGVVHFDASDSTPLFLLVFHRYVNHSGDVEFLREDWKNVVKAFEFCLSSDRNNDGLIENTIEGHGWIEGGKLYGSDAELYLNAIWLSALEGTIELAELMNDSEVKRKAEEALQRTKRAIGRFYDERTGLYILGIKHNGGRLNHFTVMTAVAVYLGAIGFEDAKRQVIPYASNDFSTDWGVRIISKSSGIFNPNGYHEGTVWPLFTGWVSLAEFKAGSTHSGFNHLLCNLLSARHFAKGYISEVYHGEVYKPSGICPHQAWSESMAIQPLVEGLLGFEANFLNRKILLSPQIPWNMNELRVKNLKVATASAELSFKRIRTDENHFQEVYQTEVPEGYRMDFSVWVPKQAENIDVLLNGQRVDFEVLEGVFNKKLRLKEENCSELNVIVSYTLPFELAAVQPDPSPFCPSSTFRLVSLTKDESDYRLLLEASSKDEALEELSKIFKVHRGFTFDVFEEAPRKNTFCVLVKRNER